MAKRLLPLFDRILIEKIIAPTKTAGGILLPESASASKLNTGVVVAVGTGGRSRDGNTVVAPVVKEGDTVVLPEYGGNTIKMGEKEFVLYREDDIIGILKDE